MQVVISAICTQGPSIRQAIGDDNELEKFELILDSHKTPGREPGWLKLRSADQRRGAINVVWDSQANILTARVVTRGTTRPSPIVGHFLNYLLTRHTRRLRAVTTAIVR
ncbi:MAG: hypothetical protein ABIZ91_00210 [Gemmatimonadaceae bacterium]